MPSEVNPNHPLRLLSLDGGGVRGLSSLLILQELMESVAKEEKRLHIRGHDNDDLPLPCDYFDLIGGTSTGGIIAVLLGRLRLDVRDCIRIYSKLAGKVFHKDHAVHICNLKLATSGTRFSGDVLENAIKEALKHYGYSEDEQMWDDTLFEEITPFEDRTQIVWTDTIEESPSEVEGEIAEHLASPAEQHQKTSNYSDTDPSSPPTTTGPAPSTPHHLRRASTWKMHSQSSVHRKQGQRGCRAFVVCALKNALALPRILATYDPNNRGTRIWEALRATSAAPTFFDEIAFGTPKMTYLDGGMGFNNPCAEVDYQAKLIWPGRSIGVIVSIGTGLQTIPSVKKGATWLPFGLGGDISLIQALASMATSTSRVDNEMQRMTSGTNTGYYRFDVDSGMANVSLEQWMKEDEMASLTKQYMRDGRQLRRTQHLTAEIVKLTALPPKFEIRPTDFVIGMNGHDIQHGHFSLKDVDFKTGHETGHKITLGNGLSETRSHDGDYTGHGGISTGIHGEPRRVYPIAQDLDYDGRKQEATILICNHSPNTCLRTLRSGIPQGRYKVTYIAAFSSTMHTPPDDLIFSVGKPYDPQTFTSRYVDVHIAPDIVPVLLHPDAVRIRVGKRRYEEFKGRQWAEIEGDSDVDVGLDGYLGIVISRHFEEGVEVGGWAFGGMRIEPVYGYGGVRIGSPSWGAGREGRGRYESNC
ncbi:FabD/lysophospholipase-like protein [Tothia fuscella]|uniref:FabD/lysophospholipase-like protein n=1 Tax=Tothia fuscella TaxID=1048955 RepID=A0A9P4P3V1_9PEZI|nr:FabD/lysophospholipase-like protein [Tothia fuscella]